MFINNEQSSLIKIKTKRNNGREKSWNILTYPPQKKKKKKLELENLVNIVQCTLRDTFF